MSATHWKDQKGRSIEIITMSDKWLRNIVKSIKSPVANPIKTEIKRRKKKRERKFHI